MNVEELEAEGCKCVPRINYSTIYGLAFSSVVIKYILSANNSADKICEIEQNNYGKLYIFIGHLAGKTLQYY